MLHFSWPTEWNRPFVDSLERRLESAIRGALSKGKASNIIHGTPTVSEIHLGTVAPRISLKHIHHLTPNRISLTVGIDYLGDASVSVKGISFNLDTTTPTGAPSASAGSSARRGTDVGKGGGVDIFSDANHSLPFFFPFEIQLVNFHLAGTLDIEITQTFSECENFYFSLAQAQKQQSPAAQPSATTAHPTTDAIIVSSSTCAAADKGNKAKPKVVSRTMPLSAMVQSLAYTSPAVATIVTPATRSAVVSEAQSLQSSQGLSSSSSFHTRDNNALRTKASSTGAKSDADQGSKFEAAAAGGGANLRLRPDTLAALQQTIHQQGDTAQGDIGRGAIPSSVTAGTALRSVRTSLTMNNRSFQRPGTMGGMMGMGAGLAAARLQGRGGIGGIAGLGGGALRANVRRPDAEEIRTGVISKPKETATVDPPPFSANEGAGATRSLSTDSPTVAHPTPRGGGTTAGHTPLIARQLTSSKQLLSVLWHRYKQYWAVPRSSPQTSLVPILTSPQPATTPQQQVPYPLRSFLEAYAFKRYKRIGKSSAPGTQEGSKAVVTVGGTKVRIQFFTDPVKSFRVHTNFTSMGFDKKLEQLLRTLLRPAIESLLANGVEFVL